MLVGKKVGNSLYVHKCGIHLLEENVKKRISQGLEKLTKEEQAVVNVFRVSLSLEDISLLCYEDFFIEPFPYLKTSWKILFTTGEIIKRDFSKSENPLILHRKELLLPKDYDKYQEYADISLELENLGAFKEYNKIGRRSFWNKVLEDLEIEVRNDKVVKKNAIKGLDISSLKVDRHKTAISRYNLSKPVQVLARYNYLNGEYSIFDYGCGKGDDISLLQESKLDVRGWDPYYFPHHEKVISDIVNLGFVINVIENPSERENVLREAFSLTRKILIVSVMLEFTNNSGESFLDGVITSRNTFQKYFSQSELIEYVTCVLHKNAIPLASGVVVVFKDETAEQEFIEKQTQKLSSQGYFDSRWFKAKESRRSEFERKFTQYKEVLESLWLKALSLGREPQLEDLTLEDAMFYKEHLGSLKKAFNLILQNKDINDFEKSKEMKRDSLIVFFARSIFSQHDISWLKKDQAFMRDVKYFFGSMKKAFYFSKEELFKVGDSKVIYQAGLKAKEAGIAFLEQEQIYILTSWLNIAPAVLRIYVNCAAYLVGDIEEYDLIKIHYESKKLSLMKFNNQDLIIPSIIERVKVILGKNTLQVFQYNQSGWPPIAFTRLSDLIPSFSDESEKHLPYKNLINHLFSDKLNLNEDQMKAVLSSNGYDQGTEGLFRIKHIPKLSDHCGGYFLYRDLIDVKNPIREMKSFYALCDLITYLIDPICEYYGEIFIVKGLKASFENELERQIYPQLCAEEKTKQGKCLNNHRGAGLLFSIEYENMFEVAEWIVEHLPFDRLVLKGHNQAIMVSYRAKNRHRIELVSYDDAYKSRKISLKELQSLRESSYK